MLAEKFGWSLYEIDMTNIESLIPFVLGLPKAARLPAPAGRLPAGKRKVYCDEVNWL